MIKFEATATAVLRPKQVDTYPSYKGALQKGTPSGKGSGMTNLNNEKNK